MQASPAAMMQSQACPAPRMQYSSRFVPIILARGPCSPGQTERRRPLLFLLPPPLPRPSSLPPAPPPPSLTHPPSLRWAEARVKITRMTLTIKLDRNWSSFQLANSAPPLSVTGSAIAPSARMPAKAHSSKHANTMCANRFKVAETIAQTQQDTSYTVPAPSDREVGSCSQASCLMRNTAMDDSIGGS